MVRMKQVGVVPPRSVCSFSLSRRRCVVLGGLGIPIVSSEGMIIRAPWVAGIFLPRRKTRLGKRSLP